MDHRFPLSSELVVTAFTGAVLLALGFPATPAAATEKVQRIGNWNYFSRVSKRTNEPNFGAFILGKTKGTFVVKCDRKGPQSVYVTFLADDPLARGAAVQREFKYRTDGGNPIVEFWRYDKMSATNAATPQVKQLADALRGAGSMVVEATTVEQARVEEEFELKGAAETIDRVYRECEG